jgi:FimV-like protein
LRVSFWLALPGAIFFLFMLSLPSVMLAGTNDDPLGDRDAIHKPSNTKVGELDAVILDSYESQKNDRSYADLYTRILDKNKQILTLRERLKFYEPVIYRVETPASINSFPYSIEKTAQKFLTDHVALNGDINYWALAFFSLILYLLFKARFFRNIPVRDSKDKVEISTPPSSGEMTRENEHEASLDFAKVLVELGEIKRARKILDLVKLEGTPEQAVEANNIVKSLPKE